MASNNKPGAGTGKEIPYSNLVWQLKLQAERQLALKYPLHELVGDPARLEEVLKAAEAQGDAQLRQLAADIRARKAGLGRPPAPPRARLPLPVLLIVPALALVVVLYMVFAGSRGQAGTAAAPAQASAVPPKVLFRMHGSNTIGEKLGPALAAEFLKRKGAASTEVRELAADERQVVGTLPTGERIAIEVFAHGSATAFKDMAAAKTDVGMASRRVKPEEKEQLLPVAGDLSLPASEHVLGLDGLAVIVNSANPLQSLTIDQIARAFSGQAKDWSELGGKPGPIAIYARDDKSGTYDTFKALVLDAQKLKLAESAKRFESSSELSDAVAGDAGGIGFIGLPYVRRSKLLGVAAGAGSTAIVPTQFTVGTEDYPLSRRLYLYLPAAGAPADAADFVDFALSDAGQDTVKDIGFVSQNLYTEKLADTEGLPADYLKLTGGAERLSANFRFETASDTLDTKAQRDLQRVVEFMGRAPGRAVLLAGFADSQGDPGKNLQISEGRAKVVGDALQARGINVLGSQGFGSAIPVASNDTSAGRDKNRRVEVWVR